MSDAQAAFVTENGVPPAAQDYLIEEAPSFKVLPPPDPHFHSLISPSGLRRKSCVLHHGRRAEGVLCARTERHVLAFIFSLLPPTHILPASQYRSFCAVTAPQVMASSPCPAQRLPRKQSSPLTARSSTAETSSSRLPSQPIKRTWKGRRERPRDVQAGAVPRPCPAKSPRPKPMATSKRMTLLLLLLLLVPTKQPSPRRRRKGPSYVFSLFFLVFSISSSHTA